MRWESFVATQMGRELQREIRLNAHSIAAPVYVSYFLPVLVNKVGALFEACKWLTQKKYFGFNCSHLCGGKHTLP